MYMQVQAHSVIAVNRVLNFVCVCVCVCVCDSLQVCLNSLAHRMYIVAQTS